MTKAELRQIYLKKRQDLTKAEIDAMSRDLEKRFFVSIDLDAVKNLQVFIPISKFNEIDTSNIYSRLWRDFPQIRTFAPRTDLTTGRLESSLFDRETVFTENSWGIRERLSGEVIDPVEIDLVIVPLLCFDESGHRVGYGRGIYDRFLADCRKDCVKVGVSCFPPVESIDDLTEYDIKLDICVTPTAVYRRDEKTRRMRVNAVSSAS